MRWPEELQGASLIVIIPQLKLELDCVQQKVRTRVSDGELYCLGPITRV